MAVIGDNVMADWVGKNGQIFRKPPQGTDPSNKKRSLEGAVESMRAAAVGGGRGAAWLKAALSDDDGLGTIDPPSFLPPASYYQDMRNHPSIAATMLVTARRAVGFQPSLVGEGLSQQQMDDFVTKFFQWTFELDNYWPYIDIKGSQTMALWFHNGDENLIDQDVGKFLGSFWGMSDEVVQSWRRALTGTVKAAAAYVTEQGATVAQVSFQTDILDTSGNKNPIQPLTFGRTAQSDGGKYDSVLTNGISYLVNSDAIIASADEFANNGLSVVGVREYVAYVNGGN